MDLAWLTKELERVANDQIRTEVREKVDFIVRRAVDQAVADVMRTVHITSERRIEENAVHFTVTVRDLREVRRAKS